MARLHSEDSHCHWCGRETRLPESGNLHQRWSEDLATVDHVDCYWTAGGREQRNSSPVVLACTQCNSQRNNVVLKILAGKGLPWQSCGHFLKAAKENGHDIDAWLERLKHAKESHVAGH